jgi:hypothetical protein
MSSNYMRRFAGVILNNLEEASTAVSIGPVEKADLKLDTLPRSQAG